MKKKIFFSMASIGVHTNASQFYLTLGEATHLNGRCVTFGRVIEGDAVLKAIEEVCLCTYAINMLK